MVEMEHRKMTTVFGLPRQNIRWDEANSVALTFSNEAQRVVRVRGFSRRPVSTYTRYTAARRGKSSLGSMVAHQKKELN